MKRLLLIGLALLAMASCKKVTPEERIDSIYTFFENNEDNYSTRLAGLDPAKRPDYLMLVLANELKADEVWTLGEEEDTSLAAEFNGEAEKDKQLSIISASLDEVDACAAALNIMHAFKELKIKPSSHIRILFFSPARDSSSTSGLSVCQQDIQEAGEMVSFDLNLSSSGACPAHTFVIEESARFVDRFLELVTPYFSQRGDFTFTKGPYPNPEWALKAPTYRYDINPDERQKEYAAVTTLTFLLNF